MHLKQLIKFYLRRYLGKVRRAVLPIFVEDNEKECLHLGCGDINQPNYTNIDCIARPHVHYVPQIDKLTRFKNDSMQQVYSSHMLEHFPFIQTQVVLQ